MWYFSSFKHLSFTLGMREMKTEDIKEIALLKQEKDKLKSENKRLTEWIDILSVRNKKLQVRIRVLEGSIRNF